MPGQVRVADLALSILEGDAGDAAHPATTAGHLPKPQEVKSFLDDYVIGQDQTKEKLARSQSTTTTSASR